MCLGMDPTFAFGNGPSVAIVEDEDPREDLRAIGRDFRAAIRRSRSSTSGPAHAS
jgi:hypothetical protein